MSTPWFDTHLHLDRDDSAEAVFAAARREGVGAFLVQGTSLDDCERTVALANPEQGVYAAVGLHPHVAASFRDMAFFRDLLAHPGVIAVGEIGLDYYYNNSPADVQREVFGRFLDLACELALPAIIHCRDAFADCHAIVKERHCPTLRCIIHSFTGTPAEADRWLELGAMLSINGMVTFNRAHNIREALAHIPMARLLLETDSPYLAPVPKRGQRNCPAFLPYIGRRVAEEKQLPPEKVADITTSNACNFLRIPLPPPCV
ncbi:MAG: TatD family hydrolase [Lentisphaeria bacterium]|jgi:TatD DNase family protein